MRYLGGRLAQSCLLAAGISLVSFILIHLAPGDPAALLYGTQASQQDIAAIRQSWGLDQPLPLQYLHWVWNFLHGDFGRSLSDGRAVSDLILERLPLTLELSATSAVLAFAVGGTLGTLSGMRPGGVFDRVWQAVSLALFSMPSFWLALLLVLFVSVRLRWLPSGSPGGLNHLVLPVLVLSVREMARVSRFARSSVTQAMKQDYIRTARMKGLSATAVTFRHALRNSLLPLVTLAGLALPQLLGGAVVVETVFAWPGLGRLAIESALQRNYSVIMGLTMAVGLLVIAGNLLADLGYALADPRVRLK